MKFWLDSRPTRPRLRWHGRGGPCSLRKL